MKKILILAFVFSAISCEHSTLLKRHEQLMKEFTAAADSVLTQDVWLKKITPVNGDTTLRNLNKRVNDLHAELQSIEEKLK